ncbi:MAG: hypothetical protein R3E95_19890 [Thiolinea sp.]
MEDSETMQQLQAIGVDFAQGFYCGKPFPFMHLCDRSAAGSSFDSTGDSTGSNRT